MKQKTKTPCLDLYYNCMETEYLPSVGLCSCGLPLLELLKPTPKDYDTLFKEWMSITFWGCGLPRIGTVTEDRQRSFTPLRQNIVLLLACLNGEL